MKYYVIIVHSVLTLSNSAKTCINHRYTNNHEGINLFGSVIQGVFHSGSVPLVDLHRLLIDRPLERSLDHTTRD